MGVEFDLRTVFDHGWVFGKTRRSLQVQGLEIAFIEGKAVGQRVGMGAGQGGCSTVGRDSRRETRFACLKGEGAGKARGHSEDRDSEGGAKRNPRCDRNAPCPAAHPAAPWWDSRHVPRYLSPLRLCRL